MAVRVWVLALMGATALLGASAVWFGRAGLSAGLLAFGVVCLLLAGRAARTV